MRWIQLLEEAETAEPPSGVTVKTDRTPEPAPSAPVLSVLTVPTEGPSAVSLDADPSWTDDDIERFKHYRNVATKAGFDSGGAEGIAERLVIRDRERDDRKACLECADLRGNGRCAAMTRGTPPAWTSGSLDCIPDLLQRCERFNPNDRRPT